MTKVLLYWNHICVLHNQEKKQLAQAQAHLAQQGIDLQIRFFGLGYESHMCEYLAREDCILPDMIVSADLEVYEHPQIFAKLGKLHPCETWMPLRNTDAVQAVRRGTALLPFVAIPLVCYTRDLAHCEGKTLAQMSASKGFAFGGINNSAAKTITKLAMQHYGDATTEQLLANASIYDMPIAAFQSVRMGQNTTAVVPSLYALRQDGSNTFMTTLAEGTCLLPSYLTCRSTLDAAIGQAIMQAIITPELCDFYAQQGNLIICPKVAGCTHSVEEDSLAAYSAVSSEFLSNLDAQHFYQLYTKHIPTARAL